MLPSKGCRDYSGYSDLRKDDDSRMADFKIIQRDGVVCGPARHDGGEGRSGRLECAARMAASRPLRSPRGNEAVLKSGHEQGRRFRRQWRNRRSDGQLGALPRSAHWETVLLAKASCRILSKGTSVGFGLTTVEIRKSAWIGLFLALDRMALQLLKSRLFLHLQPPVLLGPGSERRSASQPTNRLYIGGINLPRLFTQRLPCLIRP